MKTLFVAWQDPYSRSWFPIGRLTYDGDFYYFVYVEGANKAKEQCGFPGVWSFPNWAIPYPSKELLPLFSNRVMRPSRPDYPDLLQCLNLPPNSSHDPIAILSRTGGKRATDHFEVFPCPEKAEDGSYQIHFFSHGVRHMPPKTPERILRLEQGERLRLLHDFQNPYDRRALMLCTEDRYNVGYCPRYLLDDAFDLLRSNPDAVQVTVERVNPPPALSRLRLLCELTANWPADFRPFSGEDYQPLAEVVIRSAVAS